MKKIKILFLEYQLVCGGAEQALYDLVSLMDKSKFEITVIALYGHGEWEEKFRSAGIHVINILERRKKSLNPVCFVKHQYRKLRILYYLKKNPQELVKWLFPEGMDIVVSYSIWESDEIGICRDTKMIRFIHGNIATNMGYYDSIMRISPLLSKYDRIICVSQQAYNSFCEITGVSENVQMHFNPLNSDNVRRLSLQPVVLPKDVPIICAVGRLAPEKGYDRLIRIHKHLLEEGIVHRLVIVGDGPEKEKLLHTIEETETKETVLLTGYQSNPYPYMKNSDFLVCSSYTEGLPVIAMEALSLGIPIVSALPSIGEVFGQEICGLITKNDDTSLECGIRKMLCDSVFYRQAKLGAERRSSFFDGRRMVSEIEAVFEELCQQVQ